jgi:HD-like signal output (HDOD) protein
MNRLLFVDPDVRALRALESSLSSERHRWDMVFAASAEDGLAALREHPFEVVVCDLQWPDLGGARFLDLVRKECPEAARIAVSARTDGPTVVGALRVAHRFLPTPCPKPVLVNVLLRTCVLQSLVGDRSLRGFIARLTGLPSVPHIYSQLTTAMANPQTSFAAIGRIVEQDPALAAKLLQVVNSAHFALRQKVTRVEQAVPLLGFETLRSLALAVHLTALAEQASPIPGFSPSLLQQHSLLCARIARRLLTGADAQQAYTAALLADVGKIVLAVSLPGAFREVVRVCRGGMPALEAERQCVGFTHAAVGAYVLGLWGLPTGIIEAIAFHHPPVGIPVRSFDVVAAVHVASALTDEVLGPTPAITAEPELLDERLVASLKLDRSLPDWRRMAQEESDLPDAARSEPLPRLVR